MIVRQPCCTTKVLYNLPDAPEHLGKGGHLMPVPYVTYVEIARRLGGPPLCLKNHCGDEE
jgi:hypothetical protein